MTVQVGLAQRGGEVLDRAVRPVGDPDHVVALVAGAGRRTERGGELGGEGPPQAHGSVRRVGKRAQQPMLGGAGEPPDAGVVHRGAAPHRELAQRSGAELRDKLGGLLAQPGRRVRADPRGGERALQHAHVRLDEPRQHRVAGEVDDLGAGGVVAFDLGEGAHAEDRGAADRKRLSDRVGVVHRQDRPAAQDHRTLGLGVLHRATGRSHRGRECGESQVAQHPPRKRGDAGAACDAHAWSTSSVSPVCQGLKTIPHNGLHNLPRGGDARSHTLPLPYHVPVPGMLHAMRHALPMPNQRRSPLRRPLVDARRSARPPSLAIAALALAALPGLPALARVGRSAGTTPPKRPRQRAHRPRPGTTGRCCRRALRPRGFTLTDQDGRRVSLSDFSGRVTILAFLYTTSRTTAPLIAQQIRGALDELALRVHRRRARDQRRPRRRHAGARARVPARRSLTGRMEYLTGSAAQLRPVWRAYSVGAGERRSGRVRTWRLRAAARQRRRTAGGVPGRRAHPGSARARRPQAGAGIGA